MSEALAYARVMMLFMPVLLVFLVCTSLLRGVGDTVSPLLALSLSTLVGLGLTPALHPRLGRRFPRSACRARPMREPSPYFVALVWMGFRLRRRNSPLAPDIEL